MSDIMGGGEAVGGSGALPTNDGSISDKGMI
jgi:hypothetical protein